MKVNILLASLALLTITTACNKKAEQGPQKEAPKVATQVAPESKGIAYVEIDSLLTQYTFCVEQKSALESKSKQYEAQMASKMSQMEKAYAEFQQKMQNGSYTSQEQAQAAQQRIQKLQQEGAQLEQQLTKKMAADQEKFNRTLRDSLKSFLNDYNKTAGYDMILSKQGDNVLYANEKLNITAEVISGLNKRYNASAKK